MELGPALSADLLQNSPQQGLSATGKSPHLLDTVVQLDKGPLEVKYEAVGCLVGQGSKA